MKYVLLIEAIKVVIAMESNCYLYNWEIIVYPWVFLQRKTLNL